MFNGVSNISLSYNIFLIMRVNLKKTIHHYKGFEIHGTQRRTSGGYVLGGRHFVEGGIARTYVITKDGKYIFNSCVIEKLKYAKEEIDQYIQRQK